MDLGLELTVYRAVFVCQLGFERDEVLFEAFDRCDVLFLERLSVVLPMNLLLHLSLDQTLKPFDLIGELQYDVLESCRTCCAW